MPSGKTADAVYKVRLLVETSGEVFVRANSSESAAAAIEADLEDGGRTLVRDLVRIDETAPQERVTICGVPEPCPCGTVPDYAVTHAGLLAESRCP